MTALWIGLGVIVGAFGVAFLIGRGFAVQVPTPPMPAPEPVWGCDGCKDEAEEIAVFEAMWEAS